MYQKIAQLSYRNTDQYVQDQDFCCYTEEKPKLILEKITRWNYEDDGIEWIQNDIELILQEISNKKNVLITSAMCEFINEKIEEAIEKNFQESIYYKISSMDSVAQKNMPFYKLFMKILYHFENGLRNNHHIAQFKVEIGAIQEIVILIDWMKERPEQCLQQEPFFRNLFLSYKSEFREANPNKEDLEELAKRLMIKRM